MKTWWKRCAAAALMVAFVGCGQEENPTGAEQTSKDPTEIVVGFSQTGAESSWRVAHTDNVKAEAEKRGIKLLFADGQNVHNNQINAVNGFITKGVDVIVIAPQESIGWKPTLKECKRAGIPVVLTSRGVDGLLTDLPALARTVLQQRAELSGPQRLLLEFAGVLGITPEIAEQ